MITYEQALTANRFQHLTLKNADGTPVRARRSGKTQTWKRRPGAFSIPVKYGLKQSVRIEGGNFLGGYYGTDNAVEWEVAP